MVETRMRSACDCPAARYWASRGTKSLMLAVTKRVVGSPVRDAVFLGLGKNARNAGGELPLM